MGKSSEKCTTLCDRNPLDPQNKDKGQTAAIEALRLEIVKE